MRQEQQSRTDTTIAELSDVLGITRQAIKQRAARETWPYQEQPVRGGRRRLYTISTLPADVRDAVFTHLLNSAPAHPALDEQERRALGHPGTHAPADLSTRGTAAYSAGLASRRSAWARRSA